jgi:hypothetical protein
LARCRQRADMAASGPMRAQDTLPSQGDTRWFVQRADKLRCDRRQKLLRRSLRLGKSSAPLLRGKRGCRPGSIGPDGVGSYRGGCAGHQRVFREARPCRAATALPRCWAVWRFTTHDLPGVLRTVLLDAMAEVGQASARTTDDPPLGDALQPVTDLAASVLEQMPAVGAQAPQGHLLDTERRHLLRGEGPGKGRRGTASCALPPAGQARGEASLSSAGAGRLGHSLPSARGGIRGLEGA